MSHHGVSDGTVHESKRVRAVYPHLLLALVLQAAADCMSSERAARPTRLYGGAYAKKRVDGSLKKRKCGKGPDGPATDWRKVVESR